MTTSVDLFDFDLPAERIALRPARPRDSARMLVVNPGGERELEDRDVRDLPDLLKSGDALVFNDARVISAELKGVRERGGIGAKVSFNLHRRAGEDRWLAFARPWKRLTAGDRVSFAEGTLEASVVEKREDGEVLLAFDRSGSDLDEAVARVGALPLPPYIAQKRPADEADRTDYQTVFAKSEGAVAAPTAGLHFTPELLERLTARGISIHFVTLHVGAGTFLPMKAETIEEHRMHAEWGAIDARTAADLNAVRAAGGRIVAVGTTALRLLESAAEKGGGLRPFAGETRLFVTPGYRFRVVDALMTNFHLPRSTLFMLVAAFCGLERMKRAYAHAVQENYRFYSYGDASLLTLKTCDFRARDAK